MGTAVETPPIVNFITGNANKLREVKAILEPAIEVRSRNIDLDEQQGSIEDVAKAKCKKAAEMVRVDSPATLGARVPNYHVQIKGPVLVEDTGLCFNALNGLPGPYM